MPGKPAQSCLGGPLSPSGQTSPMDSAIGLLCPARGSHGQISSSLQFSRNLTLGCVSALWSPPHAVPPLAAWDGGQSPIEAPTSTPPTPSPSPLPTQTQASPSQPTPRLLKLHLAHMAPLPSDILGLPSATEGHVEMGSKDLRQDFWI